MLSLDDLETQNGSLSRALDDFAVTRQLNFKCTYCHTYQTFGRDTIANRCSSWRGTLQTKDIARESFEHMDSGCFGEPMCVCAGAYAR